ncbi:acidic leucine-rich nuclear phosphoprotein 32 family member A [Tanacetum coccineum]
MTRQQSCKQAKKKTNGALVHAGLGRNFRTDNMTTNFQVFKKPAFTKQPTVKDARDNKPSGWQLGDDEWQKLIDYWLNPKQMAKSTKNAQNRSKNKTPTYQGSKSYAQGRHEFAQMKAIQEDVKAKKIPFKTDKDIVREEEADRLRKENEELKKAVQSQQLEWLKFVNHFNAHQTDGYRPTYEDGSTSQIVHDDDLDGDGDGSGSLDGDDSGSLDGDSDDDSNDASDEEE